jgi:hypothetical protein
MASRIEIVMDINADGAAARAQVGQAIDQHQVRPRTEDRLHLTLDLARRC